MCEASRSDFLLLEYQDGDRLYVPVDKLQKVQKYLGIEGQEPRVDKLGGKSWEAAKKKAREAAERIAEELLNLYALRQVNDGFQFSLPDKYFEEFSATFSYEETPDQANAIDDVLEDMASTRPMDRLICGDVGYGKTEVALRAAFKAVMDGKQVAILVPTTVLAEQHYQSFKERFEGFPVQVASLSRFKTPAQQKQVLEGLKKGTVDIVVGTHRLLQKDVVFRDLGLLVIDEEHRFGVKTQGKTQTAPGFRGRPDTHCHADTEDAPHVACGNTGPEYHRDASAGQACHRDVRLQVRRFYGARGDLP